MFLPRASVHFKSRKHGYDKHKAKVTRFSWLTVHTSSEHVAVMPAQAQVTAMAVLSRLYSIWLNFDSRQCGHPEGKQWISQLLLHIFLFMWMVRTLPLNVRTMQCVHRTFHIIHEKSGAAAA